MNYNRINNILGWVIFTISLVTLTMTMAPTGPFWDCGEFLACMNELQVPHPPGAPFYMLLGRVFVLFAGNNPENVAWWGNFMSVVVSAFTVLLIFWTTTILARKIVSNVKEDPSNEKTVLIMFAGIVAALTCNFSDSFWFNAVEAEVYAMSSFFTAMVVWLIFKWEARADEPHNLKYLILIAFVMGISTGVHLLNLLTIPALALIYYFRKFKFSWGGLFLSLFVSVIILGFIQVAMMQWSINIMDMFEKNLVGSINVSDPTQVDGMGFAQGTGLMIFVLLLISIIVGLIWYSQKKKIAWLNVSVIAFLAILVGYGSYALVPIRSNADTPINENEPSGVVSFLKYMRREQYGDRPLVLGPRYNRQQYFEEETSGLNFVDLNEGMPVKTGKVELEDGTSINVVNGRAKDFKAPADAKDEFIGEIKGGDKIRINLTNQKAYRIFDRYPYVGEKKIQTYKMEDKVFFPRMHDASHYNDANYGYRNYVDNKGYDQNSPNDDQPTSAEDIKFFFDYQIAHMYLRYFMWNFAGREGDEQDKDWESGLAFWKYSGMPDFMWNQQGRNHYFFLPLLLGLFGMVFHFSVRWRDASSIIALFFFTGLAIIIYLNQTPTQPRERDYSYAGSFQTFCMWIGLGVVALYEATKKFLKNRTSWVTGAVSVLLVPCVMAYQGWDDHSRHLNYVAPDSAYNLLNSCEKNGILFTNGDNDTFPLWYLQEVEGLRTDVRVVNLSLLNTDWYINQLKKQINLSPPIPISLDQIQYVGEKNAYQAWPMRGQTDKVTLKVNKDEIIKNKVVPEDMYSLVGGDVSWTPAVRGRRDAREDNRYILKQDWLIMDILQTNANMGWPRPIYFASTIPPSSFLGLHQVEKDKVGQTYGYFHSEGLAYRVIPIKVKSDLYGHGKVNKEISYEKIKNQFRYRELANPDLYLDDHVRGTILGNLRNNIFRTAHAFVSEADELEMRIQFYQNKIIQDSISKGPGSQKEIDSLRIEITKARERIPIAQKKAKEVLDIIKQKVPVTIVPADPNFVFLVGTGYQRAEAFPEAKEYFSIFYNYATQTLDFYKKRNEENSDEPRFIQSLDYLISQYEEMEEKELGAKVADWLLKYTAMEKYQTKANELRGLGKPADEKPGPGNPILPK